MTQPCSQEPLIKVLLDDSKKTHETLDKIYDVLTGIAVQKEKVETLGKKLMDHEERIRRIEDQPRKFLVWCGGITSVVVGAWLIYELGLRG